MKVITPAKSQKWLVFSQLKLWIMDRSTNVKKMKKIIRSVVIGCAALLTITASLSFTFCSVKFVFRESTTITKIPTLPEIYQTITARIVEDLTNKQPDKKVMTDNLATINPDGSWTGIDYASKANAIWPPTEHLIKLQTLIKAYVTKNSGFYADEKVFEHISHAFHYWYNLDAKSNNWWFNEIYAPQSLGESLIMMSVGEKKIGQDLQQQLIERMKRGNPEKQAGANKLDIALHYFYRALLTADDALLTFSLKEFFSPVRLVYKAEGLQYDNSYMQHGPQLYIAGYGAVFINAEFKVANYVRETPYALSEEKVALLSKFYRNSYLKAVRGEYADFNIEGRRISRPDMLSMEKQVESGQIQKESPSILIAKQVDPKFAAEWDNALARIQGKKPATYRIKPLHSQYFNSDYTLHTRPGYSFNVRMVSKRTNRTESGNDENLLGRYLADGATNIQVDGPEYYNIMPIWEWDKIPGVTSRNYLTDKPITVFWGEQGSNDFAGGVSDGLYGASAYTLNYDSLQAKKAWFFFDDEIVCLGAGIKSDTPEEITTTINQTWLKGVVNTSVEKNAIVKNRTLTDKEKSNTWFLHGNVGYYFPKGGNVTLSTNLQKGNWYNINNSYSKDDITGNVFKLWLNHGVKPRNSEYAYIVLPAVKSVVDMEKFDAGKLEILANNSNIQAVYHKSLAMFQAVFYQPGAIKFSSFEIKVDKPCILMVKNLKGKYVISIADPLYKEKTATLIITNKNKTNTSKVDFPQNEYTGSTVEVKETNE